MSELKSYTSHNFSAVNQQITQIAKRKRARTFAIRLKSKGMHFMRRGDFGDLYVQVKTEVPVFLNKEQKELLERFRKIENEKSNPSIKKFFQKAKSFWNS